MKRTHEDIFRIKQALLAEVDGEPQEEHLRSVSDLLAEAIRLVDDLWDDNERGELESLEPYWHHPSGGDGAFHLGEPTQEANLKLARPIIAPIRRTSNAETLCLWDQHLRNKLALVDQRRFELSRATMKDGLGDPVVEDADYYVQDTRSGGCVGNCVLWWGPNGNGYTCRILEAGTYKGSAVRAMRETDLGWPKAFVDARTVVHVDQQMLRKP